jgi:Family of unknown function (DUF6625)
MDSAYPRSFDQDGPTIAFVVPYVGSWPPWFPAYLQSCKYNPSIRWIFFTDCEIPASVPANVEFVEGSLRDFERLFERKTGMSVSLEMPYKLCDYKPTFGLVFEEHLDGVDFWGHCDVDVVWGNIRKFLATDELLSSYDVISPRRRRIAGTCTLYRNADEVNRLFLADRKFERVVRERENCRYDEKGWTRFVRKQADKGALKVYWEKWMQPRGLPDSIEGLYWEAGGVFDSTDKAWWARPAANLFEFPNDEPGEVLYLDFRRWKRERPLPCDFGYEDDPQRFYLSPSAISIERALSAQA